MKTESAEQSVVRRSPDGITTHEMPGGWRVIVARLGEAYQAWYYHGNDDPRIVASCESAATRWVEAKKD